jgi:hypothetical protein
MTPDSGIVIRSVQGTRVVLYSRFFQGFFLVLMLISNQGSKLHHSDCQKSALLRDDGLYSRPTWAVVFVCHCPSGHLGTARTTDSFLEPFALKLQSDHKYISFGELTDSRLRMWAVRVDLVNC